MSHILREDPEAETAIGDPVVADIFRYDPTEDPEPRIQRYVVPYNRRMSVLTLLREIYEKLDPSIAFRNQQCGRGICGLCRCRLGEEGRIAKACQIPVKPGSHIMIGPSNKNKVIRDLVVE